VWREYWEREGVFSRPTFEGAKRFSMVIPPPNVTGKLHMGHALNMTLQDVLLRFNFLRGKDALWVPGTDHAGIATQNVVEVKLEKEGLDRHKLGREKFVERVWAWKDEYHANIKNQITRMGAGVDWKRERFTLDEQCSLAVRTAFKQLFDEGLIYQDSRIINWCPFHKTALSDIEVEHVEEDGFFYHIKYPVKGEDYALEIATTRPETLLGDSAVAVHPDDERHKKYHGKTCVLPLVGREIPIICDPYVDLEFGSGALKITPAHDPNDFEIGRAHGLPEFVMLTEDGRISDDYPAYAGMDRFEAREKIIADLEAAGLFIKKEPYKHSVGHCYRCQSAVEPYLSLQWFVRMKELAGPAMDAVKDGRTRFVPERWTKVYLDWLENIRDWCISRQLWWGHRIPVWDCGSCGTRSCSIDDLAECPKCGSKDLTQQSDVLDTWFSSGLWPLSTLGWPDKSADLKAYYPTSVSPITPYLCFGFPRYFSRFFFVTTAHFCLISAFAAPFFAPFAFPLTSSGAASPFLPSCSATKQAVCLRHTCASSLSKFLTPASRVYLLIISSSTLSDIFSESSLRPCSLSCFGKRCRRAMLSFSSSV
jgi:valyl-tRNA synthetase